MDFYEKLEFLMERDGLKNLYALSAVCEVPYTTLRSFYSNGMGNVKLSTMRKLCKYFDVTLDYLMGDEITDPNYGKQPHQNALIITNDTDKRIIKKFLELTDRNKYRVEGKIDDYIEEQEKEKGVGDTEFANELA